MTPQFLQNSGLLGSVHSPLMEKTEGIILRLADFSETSRIVTLFTRDFGKIAALAKGGRRLKGPFESGLDLLSRCRIVFIRKSSSGLDLLTESQLISRFRPRERELASLYGGYYVAELLSSLTEDYDPHPALYDDAVDVLERLSTEEDWKLPILRFELVLLREIGQLPGFEVCLVCGQPVETTNSVGFWVSQGGLICNQCGRDEYAHTHIHAGTAAVLRRLSGESESDWRRVAVSVQQVREIKQVTTSAFAHILGHRPRMLKYLKF